MIFGCYAFAGASVYYYFCCKSTLSALGVMVCFVLMLLYSGGWALSDHPRGMRLCSVLGCMLATAVLGAGILYSDQIARSPRHLFFAAVPVLGYLMLFVLQLFTPPKEISEKTQKEG